MAAFLDNGMDELPFADKTWKTQRDPGRWPTFGRYAALRDRCTTPGGMIYLFQFTDGLIKVGSSVNPKIRKQGHRRTTGQAVVRAWTSPLHLHHGLNEAAMIAALGRVGRVHTGREWFTDVDFDAAVADASTLAFPDPISLDEGPSWSPVRENLEPPLLQLTYRQREFEAGMLERHELTVFERVGLMALKGLDADSIAIREGLPVDVVPGLLWYFENLPDINDDGPRMRLAERHWARLVNDYCEHWEPIVEQEHIRIRKFVADRAADFLRDLDRLGVTT